MRLEAASLTNRQNGVPHIRIVIADDYDVVREGVRALVEAQPGYEVVGEAADGDSAWRLACSLKPHVIVLDLSMPIASGINTAERIARDCPTVKIIVLTMHEERGYLQRLMRVGASGYVLKRTASAELVRAIRVVIDGGTYVDPLLAGAMASERPSTGASRISDSRRHEGELTPRELEIIRMVARGHSNKETASALEISVKTVETHKANAMAKLGLASRAGLVRFALDEGWMI